MDIAEAEKFVSSKDLSSSPRYFGGLGEAHRGQLGGKFFLPFSDAPRANTSASLLQRMQNLPVPVGLSTGVVVDVDVDGPPVRALWSTLQVSISRQQGQPNTWSVTLPYNNPSAPLLLEFDDGLFAATTVLQSFVSSVLRRGNGVAALVYRSVYDPDKTYEDAERTIADMDGSALSVNRVTDLSVQLRGMKHSDPVLGVISAYLYDAIGDVDSIRRMAGHYIQHGQPIPYDIALLAMVRGDWRAGYSQLWAVIPPVAARKPRTEAEKAHSWTTSEMGAAQGIVGGFWPWMRQGWVFLEDPSDAESLLIRPGLTKLTSSLTPGRFATLKAQGGRELAALFELQPIS